MMNNSVLLQRCNEINCFIFTIVSVNTLLFVSFDLFYLVFYDYMFVLFQALRTIFVDYVSNLTPLKRFDKNKLRCDKLLERELANRRAQ